MTLLKEKHQTSPIKLNITNVAHDEWGDYDKCVTPKKEIDIEDELFCNDDSDEGKSKDCDSKSAGSGSEADENDSDDDEKE